MFNENNRHVHLFLYKHLLHAENASQPSIHPNTVGLILPLCPIDAETLKERKSLIKSVSSSTNFIFRIFLILSLIQFYSKSSFTYAIFSAMS